MSERIDQWLKGFREPGKPDEFESKQLIAGYGIKVPRACRLLSDSELANVDFDGPYVVKVCSAGILHKTEHRGVVVGVPSDQLESAVAEMFSRFQGQPVLVEEMVLYNGQEIILGALVDPSMGPAVMLGAGGIMTELLDDVSFRLVPCSRSEALQMIGELKVAPLFEGFRGQQLDASSLAEVVSMVSQIVEEMGPGFSQLDLNPMVQSESGWVALDAQWVLS